MNYPRRRFSSLAVPGSRDAVVVVLRNAIAAIAAVAAVAVAAFAVTATIGAPAPGSLRADRAGDDLVLTWDPDTGPYVIYSDSAPDGVVNKANYRATTLTTGWREVGVAPVPGELTFYKVDDSFRCNQDNACDNDDQCDGVETCIGRQCFPGVGVDCSDGNACTTDTCDPATGGCASEPLDCSDGDPCTLDTCDAVLGCGYEVDPLAGVGTPAEIAGNALAAAPYFDFVRSFNEDAGVEAAVDPTLVPELVGETCDVYVVEGRDAQGWCGDRTLVDVRGAPDTRAFVAGDVRDNTFPLAAPSGLSGDAGADVGRGYDVVLDCDRDGVLDPGERVDGLGDRDGFYVLDDLTALGPLAVNQFDEIGPAPNYCDSIFNGGTDDLRVYYPAVLDQPTAIDRFPLVVISHGNGHCFDWYDFLGQHLASYGYIVMGHDNDTRPGIEAASTTTLTATDRILLEQSTLGAGVLDGHIDADRIAWIGHSRGGEGVVRAYDRIRDEGYTPAAYDAGDIQVISSIAPTDFLGTTQADPHDANYHLLYGSSDGDVCGCPNSLYPFAVYERATGYRHSTYIQGADHNDFNCCGFNDFAGPAATEIGRPEAQQVQKAILLATVERYLEGSEGAEDLFWRQTESFRPIGVAATTVVTNEYRVADAERVFVLEDFQAEPDPAIASSGGAVTTDVANLLEGQMIDSDGSFSWTGSEPMNGMTRAEPTDATRGAVFDFTAAAPAIWEVEVVPAGRDFGAADYLSLRATQGTRHPETAAELADLVFAVTLVDGLGTSSSIRIDTYGGGIEEPYQRGGAGSGAGWQNEFETIRIRVADFAANGTGIDLGDIRAVRLEFGGAAGSPQGRLGLDDLELLLD